MVNGERRRRRRSHAEIPAPYDDGSQAEFGGVRRECLPLNSRTNNVCESRENN